MTKVLVKEWRDFWLVMTPCPCKQHMIPQAKKPNASWTLSGWTLSGTIHSPTFTPSVDEKVNWPDMQGYRPEAPSSRCHFTVTAGRIHYHDDCTHPLAGTTCDLLEVK